MSPMAQGEIPGRRAGVRHRRDVRCVDSCRIDDAALDLVVGEGLNPVNHRQRGLMLYTATTQFTKTRSS